MPGDLAIASVSSLGMTQKSAPTQGTKAPEPQTFSAGSGQATPATAAPVLPNPSLSIDPGLGLVVMEFRNEAGKVTSTIPTQKQLDSYRQARLQDHTPGSDMSGSGKANGTGPSGGTVGEAAPAPVAKSDATGSTLPVAPVSQAAKSGATETNPLPAPASQAGGDPAPAETAPSLA